LQFGKCGFVASLRRDSADFRHVTYLQGPHALPAVDRPSHGGYVAAAIVGLHAVRGASAHKIRINRRKEQVRIMEKQSTAVVEGSGPRGAVWLVAAFYVFAAYIFASWIMDNGRTAFADAPAPTHHSMNAASSGSAPAH
jgi:hypothetical protein